TCLWDSLGSKCQPQGAGAEGVHRSPGCVRPLASVGAAVCRGAAGPREEGGGAGAAWQLLRPGWRRQLVLLTGELWDGDRVFPGISPALLTFDSPRRGGGSPTGAAGETRGLSHCQSPLQRTLSVSAWWASVWCLLPPGRDAGRESPACAAAGPSSARTPPLFLLLCTAGCLARGSHRGTAGA
uniref:Uncharacterized protein n=1 Tax=Sus scrofa TaxID=9823 RepID=A0A8D1LF17_PIG